MITRPGIATDYSFHDGGKLRRGVPLIMAMDAAPEPAPIPAPEPQRNTQVSTSDCIKWAANFVTTMRKSKAQMSDKDICDMLVEAVSDSPVDSSDPRPPSAAMDSMGRPIIRHKPMTPAQRAKFDAMFPDFGRIGYVR